MPPSFPPGLIVYSQFVVLDPSAPNGVAISNPASILLATPDSYLAVSNTMTSARGNQSEAARRLGISRNTLTERLRRYDIAADFGAGGSG